MALGKRVSLTQARSTFFVLLLAIAIAGSFIFGRYVSSSANMPLKTAHLLASQPSHSAWQVEAQNSTETHDLTIPVGYSLPQTVAQNDTDDNSGASTGMFGSNSPLVTFQQVYELLKQNYVDRIDSDTPLAHGAVSAMIASLDDPNSRFLEPADRTAVDQESKGVYNGAGIVFTVRKEVVDGLLERQLTVIDPIAGGPAQKAGVLTGDVITDINGHWVISFDPFAQQIKLFKSLASDPVSFNHAVDATDAKIKDGLDLSKAQDLLSATSSAPLVLSILRDGHPLKVTVDASTPTDVTDVTSKLLPDGNGYIQVNDFADTTGASFEQAFSAVSSAPGVVIDMRGCPGGSMDSGLAIAKAFAPSDSLGSVVIRANDGTYDKTYECKVKAIQLSTDSDTVAPLTPIKYSGRIVILVDKGTANVAELVATFLHDKLGARIVGDKTFGDGMAQTLFPEPDGSAFVLTTGIIKTDAGQVFEAQGITPDVILARDQTDSPAGLQRAETLLSSNPINASSSISPDGPRKS
jgi:carboxyl-terminal processing protease